MNPDLFVLGQEHHREALIVTYFRLLGPLGIHVVSTALLAFILTGLILWRGKGNFAGAALVLVAFSPVMVGLFAGTHFATRNLLEIASFLADARGDSNAVVKPIEHYMLAIDALAPISTSLFLSAPTYLLAMIGAFIKSIRGREVTAPTP